MLNQLDSWLNRRPFRLNFPELVDGLFASGVTDPALVVFVDGWTSLGGSQFLDSPGTGDYHTYLCDEVVDWVDSRFRTLAHADHRGIMGHSSGGYGAMISCLLRPDRFRGFASHAGDALFEVCYQPDFGRCARTLRDQYQGSFERFLEDLRTRPVPLSGPGDHDLLNVWCLASCYSTDPDRRVRLPFEVDTGRLLPEIWQRWLDQDPVRMILRLPDAARSLRAAYVDAGRRDEFLLDLGAGAVQESLGRVGASDVRFELFDGGHTGVEHRFPISLRYLIERLGK